MQYKHLEIATQNLDALPHMYNFLRKFVDPILVNGTITFIKSVGKDSNRKVEPEFWGALRVQSRLHMSDLVSYQPYTQRTNQRPHSLFSLQLQSRSWALTTNQKGIGS